MRVSYIKTLHRLTCEGQVRVSHLEDGKHNAAEGSVVRELRHVKDIKAPLV